MNSELPQNDTDVVTEENKDDIKAIHQAVVEGEKEVYQLESEFEITNGLVISEDEIEFLRKIYDLASPGKTTENVNENTASQSSTPTPGAELNNNLVMLKKAFNIIKSDETSLDSTYQINKITFTLGGLLNDVESLNEEANNDLNLKLNESALQYRYYLALLQFLKLRAAIIKSPILVGDIRTGELPQNDTDVVTEENKDDIKAIHQAVVDKEKEVYKLGSEFKITDGLVISEKEIEFLREINKLRSKQNLSNPTEINVGPESAGTLRGMNIYLVTEDLGYEIYDLNEIKKKYLKKNEEYTEQINKLTSQIDQKKNKLKSIIDKIKQNIDKSNNKINVMIISKRPPLEDSFKDNKPVSLINSNIDYIWYLNYEIKKINMEKKDASTCIIFNYRFEEEEPNDLVKQFYPKRLDDIETGKNFWKLYSVAMIKLLSQRIKKINHSRNSGDVKVYIDSEEEQENLGLLMNKFGVDDAVKVEVLPGTTAIDRENVAYGITPVIPKDGRPRPGANKNYTYTNLDKGSDVDTGETEYEDMSNANNPADPTGYVAMGDQHVSPHSDTQNVGVNEHEKDKTHASNHVSDDGENSDYESIRRKSKNPEWAEKLKTFLFPNNLFKDLDDTRNKKYVTRNKQYIIDELQKILEEMGESKKDKFENFLTTIFNNVTPEEKNRIKGITLIGNLSEILRSKDNNQTKIKKFTNELLKSYDRGAVVANETYVDPGINSQYNRGTTTSGHNSGEYVEAQSLTHSVAPTDTQIEVVSEPEYDKTEAVANETYVPVISFVRGADGYDNALSQNGDYESNTHNLTDSPTSDPISGEYAEAQSPAQQKITGTLGYQTLVGRQSPNSDNVDANTPPTVYVTQKP